MSDLDSFSPSEGSEGVDAGALDRLKEKMQEAAKGMKRDQQQEQKQKKSEDALYNVLVTFINQLGSTHPLVKHIVNALSSNMLSGVILVIIALNYPTLQKIVELKLIEADTEETSDTALVVPDFANGDMPLYMRINVESWIKLINDTIFANPVRNLQSIKNRQNPEVPVLGLTNLLSYIIQDYLQQHKLDFDGAAADKFIKAIASNLLFRLDQHVLQTKNLTSTNENPA